MVTRDMATCAQRVMRTRAVLYAARARGARARYSADMRAVYVAVIKIDDDDHTMFRRARSRVTPPVTLLTMR